MKLNRKYHILETGRETEACASFGFNKSEHVYVNDPVVIQARWRRQS